MVKTSSLMRKFTVALFAVLVALCCGMLAGCADNSDEEIRTAIGEKLDSAKQIDEAALASANQDPQLSQLSQAFAIEPADIFKALYADFTYSVDNIEIDGDNATADVVISVKDANKLQETLIELATNLEADESLNNMTADELKETVGARTLEALKNMPTTDSAPITVKCTKKDGTWQMTTDPSLVIQEVFYPTSVMNR